MIYGGGFALTSYYGYNVPSVKINRYRKDSWHEPKVRKERVGFKRRNAYSRRRSRIFHRVMSGIQRARAENEPLRVMTLTSSNDSDISQIKKHFQVLRKRIEHEYGKLIEYCCIATVEGEPSIIQGGHGVLHIIYKGCFINHAWLSETWQEIHKASIVYLQYFRNYRRRKATDFANYLCNYFTNKHHNETRLSWSWMWVCKGFVTRWKEFIRFYCIPFGYTRLIDEWKVWISRPLLVDLYKHVYWNDVGQKFFEDYPMEW